jgi:heme exporter protein D
VTADHWNFVLAAYGLAALVLGVYWRHLCRRDRDLMAQESRSRKKSA